MRICPECDAEDIIKYGKIRNGKQRFRCKKCGRQFADNPEKKTIPRFVKDIIDELLPERLSLAGIAGTMKVSEAWLQNHVNKKYGETPKIANVTHKPKGKLIIGCDEMWSCVGKKSNKIRIWPAKDRGTGEIVGFHAGNRDREGAKALWDSLPGVYRQCAVCYTDFWSAYEEIFPSKRHRAAGKETGETNRIERHNNTMRQRCSRLVRKTLSFSKKIENHIGAIWYFIHHYNASLPCSSSMT